MKEVPFGPAILDPTEVEPALRRAQIAVLNTNLLTKSLTPEQNLLEERKRGDSPSFSRNVVCIDIAGEGLVDSSFIDMPGVWGFCDFPTLPHLSARVGLVANAEPEVVNVVEDMVISRISGNALILVVIPMTGASSSEAR